MMVNTFHDSGEAHFDEARAIMTVQTPGVAPVYYCLQSPRSDALRLGITLEGLRKHIKEEGGTWRSWCEQLSKKDGAPPGIEAAELSMGGDGGGEFIVTVNGATGPRGVRHCYAKNLMSQFVPLGRIPAVQVALAA